MNQDQIIVYPVQKMIDYLVADGYGQDPLIQELDGFADNTAETNAVETFMTRMEYTKYKKGSSECQFELDDYIQVCPIVDKKAVLFAKKEFLLSVMESNPVNLDRALSGIAFRYAAGHFPSATDETPIASFKDQLFAALNGTTVAGFLEPSDTYTIFGMTVKTIDDLTTCNYQKYFSTVISIPIMEAIDKAYGPFDFSGYPYEATIDFIIGSLIERHNDTYLRKYGNAVDVVSDSYLAQSARNLLKKANVAASKDAAGAVKSFSFSEEDMNYDTSGLSILSRFVNLGNKEGFECADTLILNISQLTEKLSNLLEMFNFEVDRCAANRYRLYHNKHQKLFIVVIDG